MHVLHLNDRLSSRGGADWHLHGVLDGLAELGCQVSLAVGRIDGTYAPTGPCSIHPSLANRTRDEDLTSLNHLVETVQPTVVHLHNIVNPAVIEWAGKTCPAPAVQTVQDHRYFCPGSGKLRAAGERCRVAFTSPQANCRDCFDDDHYFRQILAVTTARFAALQELPLIVLSQYMKDELVACGMDAAQVEVIPPFVHGFAMDTDQEDHGREDCILYCGRLTKAKGAWAALTAWQRSTLSLPLIYAGTGSLRQALEGAGADVRGWLDRNELTQLLRRSRALLLPPRWQEPFGIVGLEAANFSVPVVAWRSGGIEEWHGDDDLLVDWGDIDGLAQALERAVSRRASPLQAFVRTNLMKQLVAHYTEIVKNRRNA